MGPGIFTFSRACFSFVSKRFKTTETLVNFCHVSVHFKNISKHQKWGLFQFVSKQLKYSAIFIIFSAFQSFETTETIEPFGLVLDLVNFQRFISVYSLYVSMFLTQDVSPRDFLDLDVSLPDVSPPNILDQDVWSLIIVLLYKLYVSVESCHVGEFTSNFS